MCQPKMVIPSKYVFFRLDRKRAEQTESLHHCRQQLSKRHHYAVGMDSVHKGGSPREGGGGVDESPKWCKKLYIVDYNEICEIVLVVSLS